TQAQALWALRENLSEVQRFAGGSIKNDISVPVARIPEFIERANALIADIIPGARPVPFGHYGDGNIHYNISQPDGGDKQAFLARWDEVTDAINALLGELRGSISAEHGIGRMKRAALATTKSPVEIQLMRRIKHALDPKGIFNPDKVV
ncbi:MAG: FAD-linked oxidase C-terminal domain-containing protein, partial [Pseudomonadota bacterium]